MNYIHVLYLYILCVCVCARSRVCLTITVHVIVLTPVSVLTSVDVFISPKLSCSMCSDRANCIYTSQHVCECVHCWNLYAYVCVCVCVFISGAELARLLMSLMGYLRAAVAKCGFWCILNRGVMFSLTYTNMNTSCAHPYKQTLTYTLSDSLHMLISFFHT